MDAIAQQSANADGYQDMERDDNEEIPDTTLFLREIYISDDSMVLLKRKKEFAYVSIIDSLLKAKQDENIANEKNATRSLSFLDRLFNTPFLKFIFWTMAASAVLFILIKLFNTHGIFSRGGAIKNAKEKEDVEKKYTQNDYTKLVQQSCRLGDYRAAVKYLFLRTLQQLHDQAYIEYTPDKTNYNYLQEIIPDKKKEFSRLILNYEYTWYGNMHLEKNVYEKMESEFITFQQKM
jgi:hypothetical protein